MKKFRGKLTYANVVSSLCLFLLLGGATAFAAGLGKNTVGTKQLKKNAVTTAKIKNGAVKGAKINLGTLGTVPSAANANTLGGKAAGAFAASTVIRSASVFGKGTLIPALSDGIAQGNISHTTGLTCFRGLSPAPITAVAQFAFEATPEAEIFVQVNPNEGTCAGAQIAIATEKKGGGFMDEPFEMIVH